MTEKKMGTSGFPWRANRDILLSASRRLAVIAVIAGVGASAPMLLGAGPANASTLVPCTWGPVGSRLEVDCTNNDITEASVDIGLTCTNLANLSVHQRMTPQSKAHYTRDCGLGAHPIFWNVLSISDSEQTQQDLWQQHLQDEQTQQDLEQQLQHDQQDRENHHK